MAEIELTQGKVTIVDDSDFEWLNQWKWRYVGGRQGYAKRHSPRIKGKRTSIYMHRLINNTPEGMETDHINRNKLDNRKENLRTATRSLNQRNKGLQKNNVVGHPGIVWNKGHERWEARIKINNKQIYLGNYTDLEQAILSRKEGEKKYYDI